MVGVEKKTFRFFEVSFYILSVSILVLLSIVIYFVGQQPKICIEDNKRLEYDNNADGIVDIIDLLEEVKKIESMKEYIINED